ncbi:MAG: bifunctional tetrahydrofolate synthase/dihydrofolate synthase [Neisseriaceae bacterium]|nr:bifunctional tetrahydrofolate synthase/dihydrofolate synthase [Neisseriaceae bacterium]
MSQKTLAEWLAYFESVHPSTIDMGLSRVEAVRQRLQLVPRCPVITVSGTNGKGSVCAFLSKIYASAGFKVGTLTSPHLLRFNERIALNAEPVSDEEIVISLERIEAARGDVSLTYFEMNALAAVDVFDRHDVDVMVLEVGLGGRLDAVNVFDADCAVVTSVDLDHQAYLGDTIEAVAFEKAGIFRAGKPAVCGQNPVPESLAQHAASLGVPLSVYRQDFGYTTMDQQWRFTMGARNRHALPMPALRGQYQLANASCALAAIELMHPQLPIDIGAIKRGLVEVTNPGRFQVLPGRPTVVLDVGHNPHAARALVASLRQLPFAQKRIAVFAMLADKDIDGVIELCKDEFDEWYVASLTDMPRGASAEALVAKLNQHGIHELKTFANVTEAYQAALLNVTENDRITVFGSFFTVAHVLSIKG